ncbi:MAG: hypothetical protein ACQER9_01940 [Nanobdellota archaeon]
MNSTLSNNLANILPQNSFVDFLGTLNNEMGKIFSGLLPENILTNILVSHPLLIIISTVAILGLFALFADFIADAWKIPIAIIVDVIDLMAISAGLPLDAIAAGSSLIMFFILTADCPKAFHYGFSIIGPLKCIAPIPVLGTLPINTVLMMVAAIVDKGL